jgi:hypothetical protein
MAPELFRVFGRRRPYGESFGSPSRTKVALNRPRKRRRPSAIRSQERDSETPQANHIWRAHRRRYSATSAKMGGRRRCNSQVPGHRADPQPIESIDLEPAVAAGSRRHPADETQLA